jgi:transposase
VDAIEAKGGEAVIPARTNRTVPREIDAERYKDRNLVEQFWAKVEQYRRVATRYEKTSRNFLGMVLFAAITLWLK